MTVKFAWTLHLATCIFLYVDARSVYSYVIYVRWLRSELDSDWADKMNLRSAKTQLTTCKSVHSQSRDHSYLTVQALKVQKTTLNHTNRISVPAKHLLWVKKSHSSKCGINQSSEIESGEWHTKKASVRSREFLQGWVGWELNSRPHWHADSLSKSLK